MVAKISVGNSLYGALSYNQLKVEAGEGKVLSSNNMVENHNGELDISSAMRSFEHHLSQNNKTKKPILHISLNPHPDDKLSDDKFVELAQDYMERMGYGEQPYIIYKHEDIERHHIHIVTTNVDKHGCKIKDGNNFYLNNKVCRELEQKYNLNPATKRQEERQAFTFKKVDAAKGNTKIQIGNVIKPLAATYKFQSFGEYRTLLAQYNICVEESKGVRGGQAYEGLIYYATNGKDEKISNPFKSSLYGKSVGYKSIQDKCKKHKTTIKNERLGSESATRINSATNGISDKDRYIEALKRENIDVLFRENDKGRIYGATFIDHNNHCVFNGSRLGKEFSANAFQELFDNRTTTTHNEGTEHGNHEHTTTPSYSEDGVMGGLLDILSTDAPGDDPEEEAFRRRLKKEQQKGRRL